MAPVAAPVHQAADDRWRSEDDSVRDGGLKPRALCERVAAEGVNQVDNGHERRATDLGHRPGCACQQGCDVLAERARVQGALWERGDG